MNPEINITNQTTDNKIPLGHLNRPALPEQPDGLPQIVFPPSSRRPVYCCYDGPFLVRTEPYPAGVYFHRKDDSGTLSDRWVCSVLRVIAITRSEAGKRVCIVEFVPQGATQKRRDVISEMRSPGPTPERIKSLAQLGCQRDARTR